MDNDPESVVVLSLGAFKIPVPRKLYLRLATLAESVGQDLASYVQGILSDQESVSSSSEYSTFSPEARALIRLYEFCFDDSEQSRNALGKLVS